MQDLALNFGIHGETVDTAVPWDRAHLVVQRVKQGVARECKLLGVTHFATMFRLTQSYDAGCCIYFYFVFNTSGQKDPLKATQQLESKAREEIIAVGGKLIRMFW